MRIYDSFTVKKNGCGNYYKIQKESSYNQIFVQKSLFYEHHQNLNPILT
ncbi:hypothetical protein LEP1GSC126_3030 [Leptospira kirschneri str. 200801774]|nr:hypothetical protein LEP1GSC126_3030 [Leptospira kirschneri str. 200801774]